jgi:hypothetical protein
MQKWRRKHERDKVYSEVLVDSGASIILQLSLIRMKRRISIVLRLIYVHRLLHKILE